MNAFAEVLEISEYRRSPRNYERTVTRQVDLLPAAAFEAWTTAERLAPWFGPKGFILSSWESQLELGADYRGCIRAPDGTEYWFHGTYQEIVPDERLVFTFTWEPEELETVVTVTFAARGNGTQITLRHAGLETRESADGHEEGWTECLERLVAHARAGHDGPSVHKVRHRA